LGCERAREALENVGINPKIQSISQMVVDSVGSYTKFAGLGTAVYT
jgi:hypothetical protein